MLNSLTLSILTLTIKLSYLPSGLNDTDITASEWPVCQVKYMKLIRIESLIKNLS